MVSAAEFLKWLNVFKVTYGGGSITIPVSMGQGGTGAALTPSAGSLFYSTASQGALLPTIPNGVLVTDAIGNPSISTSLPTGMTVPGYLPLSGGTMTGNLTLSADPTTPLEAATKQYADAIASGFIPVGVVYAASTGNLAGYVYNNGSSGVGATLTAGSNGVFTGDGVNPPVGQFFLYKDDTTYSGVANGIYQVTTSSSGTHAVLTRATYYNSPSQIKPGTLVSITNGATQKGSTWYETNTVTAVGTDPIAFSAFFLPTAFLQVNNNLSDLGSVPTSLLNLGFLPACKVTATANMNVTYSNGSSGVGATITDAGGTFAPLVIDSLTVNLTDPFLVPNQTSALQNGVYVLTTQGDGISVPWQATRATWFNQGVQMVPGKYIPIYAGTSNGGSIYVVQAPQPVTIGTDSIILKSTLEVVGSGFLRASNNLSDVASVPTSVANLGLTIGTNTEAWSAVLDQVAAGTYTGSTSITTLGTIATGTWNGSPIIGTYGGTGVNNGASTITVGGNVTFSGAHTFTGNLTANTNVTFPTSGTLATTAQIPTPAALTEFDDTNVTLTLGGTPATALLQAVSLTLGWTGTLAGSRGGLGAAITASNGGIYYSTATNGALLAGTATAQQMLMSGTNSAPTWSTNVWPNVAAANSLLWASTTNTISALATLASAGLLTNVSGVPGWVAYTGAGAPVLANTPTLITPILGTPQSVTLTNATGLPLTTGVTGILPLANGGTNNNLTASLGGIVWSDASKLNILAGTATANLPLLSGSSATPAWGAYVLSLGGALTTAGALTLSGAFGATFTFTNTTSVTFPTSGTLATTAQIPTFPVSLANGGTGASLSAVPGGVFYCGASVGALSAAGSSGQLFISQGTSAPIWTTTTYPLTNAINTIMYASSANVLGVIAPVASSVMISSAGGVPSWGSTLPTGVQTNITELGTITVGTWQATPVAANFGGTGVANLITSTITLGGAFSMIGAYSFAGTLTGNTTVTFPTSGTLATTTDITAIQTWCQFNGTTNTIIGSFNITSVTKNATGEQTFNFTSSYADANYSCVASSSVESSSNNSTWIGGLATNSAQIITANGSAIANSNYVNIIIAGT